jgi:ATPase subunit of ABC transporter with duplicated ATPase domains
MFVPVTFAAVSYSTPDGTSLFSQLDLSFGAGRTGIIGRNGTGKTTLLRLVTGELTPHSGSVSRPERIGLVRQAVQSAELTVAAALGTADALARLERIEAGRADEADFGLADWGLPQRIAGTLASVGLAVEPDRPLATLSGGQRTRVQLAAALLAQPDLLLLDEPTNNLDAEGREAVADILGKWRGGAIVVSHDRALLRQVDAIVELTSLGARTYGGNWDAYKARKDIELAAAEHRLDAAEQAVRQVDRQAQQVRERQDRRNAAGKRKAARGDIPRIMLGGMKENAERTTAGNKVVADRRRVEAEVDAAEARAEIEILTPLTVSLVPTGLPAGRTVLEASGLSGGPGERPVIRRLDLRLVGPERVAINGPNGSGKTSLLRLLTDDLAPTEGTVRITPRLALLDQQVSLLDPEQSIRDNFRRLNPEASENDCRAALARMMFRADAALQGVASLSGGEMLRAALACTIGSVQPPELLILDEPTNHLDIHAIAAVEAGLRAYDGALLVVSHDRDFLEAIGIERELWLSA